MVSMLCITRPQQPQPQPKLAPGPPPLSGGVLVTPQSQDVLFGRCKPLRSHPGNIEFRRLLEGYADQYNESPKFVKKLMTVDLVKAVVGTGARFLRQTTSNDGYIHD